MLALVGGCHKAPPLVWAAPAHTGLPAASCRPTSDAELASAVVTGLELDAHQLDALFPELELQQGWVARAELRAEQALVCEGLLVLQDPELRLWNRRGEQLDVALVTGVLVHPRMIMALEREQLQVQPPEGAWLARDRKLMTHHGYVVVGRVEER